MAAVSNDPCLVCTEKEFGQDHEWGKWQDVRVSNIDYYCTLQLWIDIEEQGETQSLFLYLLHAAPSLKRV